MKPTSKRKPTSGDTLRTLPCISRATDFSAIIPRLRRAALLARELADGSLCALVDSDQSRTCRGRRAAAEMAADLAGTIAGTEITNRRAVPSTLCTQDSRAVDQYP